MPILYNMDVDFNIAIFDFVNVTNISGISNKVWNEADGEGADNNGWDSASDNSEDDDNKEDNNNKEDDDNGEDIGGVKI